jgi:hypothetical protein
VYKPSRNVYEIPNSERPHSIDHKLIGPAKHDDLIAVTLLIRSRPDSPPLPDLEYWQRTPIGKRRFLTPEEFAQTYGAAQADLDKVTAFVSAHNMTVLKSHAGKCSVSVQGTVAQMNKAFGIYLNRYEAPLPTRNPHSKRSSENIPTTTLTHTHYGYDGPVYLPNELADIVTGVIGLDNRIISVPGVGNGDPTGATLLHVTDAANAYQLPNDGPNLTMSHQTIGIIAMQLVPGTTITQPNGSTFTVPNDYGGSYLESDIDQYISSLPPQSQTRPSAIIPVSLTVATNTYANNPSLVSSISSTTNYSYSPWNDILETTGDISISAAISQGATINVYFTENTQQGWLAFLQEVLLPEQGESQPTVVSISYSLYPLSEDTSSVELQLSGMFQKLAAVGIPIFVDAGDWGAGGLRNDGNTHVLYPASDPWITCCGGTVMTINSNPTTGTTGITDEVVWSDSFNSSSPFGSSYDWGSTGGGSSSTFPNPPYQTAAGITQITDSNGTTYTGHRFIPDVAGMIGYTGLFLNALSITFEGTSAVGPLYAGYCAVLQQDFGVPLGFLNPTLYQLGNTTAFNDVKSGNNNSGDSSNPPFFSAGPGWDPCTGWGSINGLALLNSIASLMFRQNFYFQVDKSTYGFDEVKNASTYPSAFWLALEGFTPKNVPSTQNATVTLAWSQSSPSNPSLDGVSITVNALLYEIPTQPNTPQRIIFPCTVSFDPTTTAGQNGIFPAPGATAQPITLTATITIGTTPPQNFSAVTVITLVSGADPFFTNINPNKNNVFYLSQDLRVFTATPGINNTPISGVSGAPALLPPGADPTVLNPAAGYNYIEALLNYLNENYSVPPPPSSNDPLNTLFPDQSNVFNTFSSVTPTAINPANPTGTPFTNYNFAIARVRLNGTANSTTGTSPTGNVRVFFRLFASQSPDTDYNTNTTYVSNTVDGTPTGLPRSPKVGSTTIGTSTTYLTVPFFATGNLTGNLDYINQSTGQSINSVNNQPITIGASGSVWAYYGCYIDIYSTTNPINGQPIYSILPADHNCLVAQIAFDDTPISNQNGTTENPDNSDKLAQRNLQIIRSENPGPPSTHRIPQVFDIRPSPAIDIGRGDLLGYPDELMIEWGNTPVGSRASIYWPQVNATDVLTLAEQIYSTHQLSVADANTIQCTVTKGITFVPIPPIPPATILVSKDTGENFAGLFTVDLPTGIVQGHEFNITVRRIATRRNQKPPPVQPDNTNQKTSKLNDTTNPVMENWRYVTGTFGVQIPVTNAETMLPPEMNALAIRKWGLGNTSPTNRWYPVQQRYVSYIAGRVDGLGGNSEAIPPSSQGAPPSQIYTSYTGIVIELLFDSHHFIGFRLETEQGEKKFLSSKEDVERKAEISLNERRPIEVWSIRHVPHSVVCATWLSIS